MPIWMAWIDISTSGRLLCQALFKLDLQIDITIKQICVIKFISLWVDNNQQKLRRCHAQNQPNDQIIFVDIGHDRLLRMLVPYE